MRAKKMWTCLVLGLCLAVPGCGGGGGTLVVPPAVIAFLKAQLLGSNPTSVIDPDASATIVIQVMDDGEFRFAATAEAGYVGDIISATLRRGTAGVDGPSILSLTGGGAGFNAQTYTIADNLSTTAVLAAEVATTPGNFYCEIRTSAAPNGLVRGQLAPFGPDLEWHATLLGTNETTVADPNGRGAATFRVASDGTVNFVIAMVQPVIGDVANAHIHVGEAGVDGTIVLDLDPGNATLNAANGTLTGSVTISRDIVSRICQKSLGFYCNVHTTAAPAGVVRGQTTTGTVEMWSTLTGDQETTVIDANARGGATFEFFDFTTGLATLAVPQAQSMTAVNGAHIHTGALGVDGGILTDLQSGADYNVSEPTGSADGTMTYDQETLTRIMADPHSFYCNFHTAAAPAGLVRGQLTRDPQTIFADLSGSEETTVVDPSAAGSVTAIFSRVHECDFVIDITNPTVADLTGAHIHDGFAASDGPILVNFLAGNTSINGFITGCTVVSGRTFARLLAEPEQLYVNAHTAAAPAGIARGQCQHITGDTPPAGLVYSTPVVYMDEIAITPNVPASSGGAITSYGVSPALPTGLILNATTGIISGTPRVPASAQDYTVTALNAAGQTQATINITVVESLPTSLAYFSPITYSTGTPIAPNSPVSTGGTITNYTITALPMGLSINSVTGVISGTPTLAVTAANYVVTGTNGAGSIMATVNITVTQSLQPPSGLSYTTPVTYTTGTAIAANTPTIGGGTVATWSINQALSAGLTFNTGTGVISGTPTAVNGQTTYTVTATNASGSTQASVVITVNLGAPTNLSYSPNSSLGYVTGGTFTSMSPSSQGGAVATYTIIGTGGESLPTGITINASTGVIGGTPTATSSATTYTVTATNATGNTTAQVTITVLP